MDKIVQIIEKNIRPLLRGHQGDIEYLETTADGFVRVL